MQKPNLNLSIDRDLLDRLIEAAELQGTSLDAFVATTLKAQLRDRDRDQTARRLVEWTDSQII